MAYKRRIHLDEVEPVEYPKGTLMWAENNNNAYSEVPNRVNTIKSQPQTTNSKPKVNNSYKPSRTTSNSSVGNNEYTVKRGDSLWKIAQQYGTTVAALKAANPEIKGNMIYPNQIIKINVDNSSKSTQKTNTSRTNTSTRATTNNTTRNNEPIYQSTYNRSSLALDKLSARYPIQASRNTEPENTNTYQSVFNNNSLALDKLAARYPITAETSSVNNSKPTKQKLAKSNTNRPTLRNVNAKVNTNTNLNTNYDVEYDVYKVEDTPLNRRIYGNSLLRYVPRRR